MEILKADLSNEPKANCPKCGWPAKTGKHGWKFSCPDCGNAFDEAPKPVESEDFEPHDAAPKKSPFKEVHDASDARGMDLTDHTVHLPIATLPKSVQRGATRFAEHVLNKEGTTSEDADRFFGATPKVLFSVPGETDEHGVVGNSTKFMVKPYHENFSDWPGVYYPISGFSEMATQAIFHAADMGQHAQKVHTFEDKTNGRPLLSIEISPNYTRFNGLGDVNLVPTQGWDQLTKLGFLDYLTNHQDRHGGNLMATKEIRANPRGLTSVTMGDILSIDNGRSFGYREGQRHSAFADRFDHLFAHVLGPAISSMASNLGYTPLSSVLQPARLAKTFRWWDEHRDAILDAFNEQLLSIPDPHVRDWIHNNFKQRVDMLDQMSALIPNDATEEHVRSIDPGYISRQGNYNPYAKPVVNNEGMKFVNRNRKHPHGEDFFDAGNGNEEEDPAPESEPFMQEPTYHSPDRGLSGNTFD